MVGLLMSENLHAMPWLCVVQVATTFSYTPTWLGIPCLPFLDSNTAQMIVEWHIDWSTGPKDLVLRVVRVIGKEEDRKFLSSQGVAWMTTSLSQDLNMSKSCQWLNRKSFFQEVVVVMNEWVWWWPMRQNSRLWHTLEKPSRAWCL